MKGFLKKIIENKVVLITGAAGKLGTSLSKSILENNGKIRSFTKNERRLKEYFYPNENDCNDAISKFIS